MGTNRRGPSVAARRFGYVLAAVITAAIWLVINEWPGWQELSFLTDETQDVLPLVNFSLIVSVAVNLIYAVRDPRWLKSLGDLVTTGIGLAVMVRLWQVFPFDFSGDSINWAVLARILLVMGIVGSCIGILVQIVTLARVAYHRGATSGGPGEVHG